MLEELNSYSVLKWQQGNIPVVYEAYNVAISPKDKFPSYFACKPEMGHLVESTTGRRLAIKSIVHSIENNKAVLKIILGKDTGGQSATSGGGSQEVDW